MYITSLSDFAVELSDGTLLHIRCGRHYYHADPKLILESKIIAAFEESNILSLEATRINHKIIESAQLGMLTDDEKSDFSMDTSDSE